MVSPRRWRAIVLKSLLIMARSVVLREITRTVDLGLTFAGLVFPSGLHSSELSALPIHAVIHIESEL